mgnify:CR=1 FL=1
MKSLIKLGEQRLNQSQSSNLSASPIVTAREFIKELANSYLSVTSHMPLVLINIWLEHLTIIH